MATAAERETAEQYKARQTELPLRLEGCSTDHIWCMEDIPGLIGMRMDCGDGGVVYLTYAQAHDLASQLQSFISPTGVA